MAYAHSEGVVHLDLKPDNIRVSRFGDVAVCDWGLANLLDREEEMDYSSGKELFTSRYRTLTGQIKGTPGYMAPEQARGQGEIKDERTDIFSLGCILYQILTLRLAIKGKSLERILDNTCNGDITPPSKRRPDITIPDSLEAICLKALELEPDDRYQYVEEMTADIEAYREGFATVAENVSLTKQLHLFYLRNRNFCLTVFFLLSIISALTAYFIGNMREKEQNARYALQHLEKEQEINRKISREAGELYAVKAEKAYLNADLDLSLEFSNLALLLDPNHRKALEYLGKVSFAKQKFGDAYKCLRRLKNKNFNDIIKFCETVAKQQLKSPVPVSKLYAYLNLIGKEKTALRSQLMANSVFTAKDPASQIKWLLERENKLNNVRLSLKKIGKGKYSLDLKGNKLKTINIISHFPISILNLENTNIMLVDQKFSQFAYLKTLEISKGHSSKNLAALRRKIKVVER